MSYECTPRNFRAGSSANQCTSRDDFSRVPPPAEFTAAVPTLIEPDIRMIQPVVLAAIAFGQPVAMALLELPTDANSCPELLSLFVAKPARRHGVATYLLAAVEPYLFRRGHRGLLTVYMTGKPGIEYFEKALAKRKLHPPEQRMITVRFVLETLMQADWINKYKPQAGYRIGAWSDVSAAEMGALRASNSNAPAAWIAPDLAPWLHDANGYEPQTSIGIYYRDEIVGRLINHALNSQTAR